MLKVDFTKLLLSNSLIYVLTFMPGLFFLTAVAVADPALSSQLIARFQFTIPLDHSTTVFAFFFLFLAFVAGATFITLVGLIQHLPLRYACTLWFLSKPFFSKHVFLPVLNRLLTVRPPAPNSPPPKPKPAWLYRLHRKAWNAAFPPEPTSHPAFLWWEALAKQLFEKRFGMKEVELPAASLEPVRQVLTEPTPRERHGDAMLIALHATGWSALAAAYFAPELRTTWFYVFALFLIASGLHHDITVVSLLLDPDIGDTLRLRAVLREFPKLKAQPGSDSHTIDKADEDE